MLESLQSSTAELQYQIRDLTDRNALLTEQLADAQRELEYRSQQPSLSAEDTDRIRAASEARYKAKVDELTMRLAEAERDRNDMESALSRNLQQKTQEIEALKKVMDTSSQSKGVGEEEMRVLKQEIDSLRHETSLYKEQLSDLDRQRDRVNELEVSRIVHCTFDLKHLICPCRHNCRGKMLNSMHELNSTNGKFPKLEKENVK